MAAKKEKPGPSRLKLAAVILAALAAVLLLGWMLLNLIVDPFGVFGDRFLGWWAYNETRNPQTAKFSYLEQHHEEFDSYVVGGPSAGAWDTGALNRYFDAKFYNLTLNTQDMEDIRRYVCWLIEHYEVKHLVLNVTVDSARDYGPRRGGQAVTDAMPFQLDGSSPVGYYLRYLFANPRYSLSKLKRMGTDSVIPNSFDVFDAATGSIDYCARDVEAIGTGTLEEYIANNPSFATLPEAAPLARREECADGVAAIRTLCEMKGVDLVVVAAPVYYDYLARFSREEVEEFLTTLARVTPYWDFTSCSLSRDPRYFYDPACFRTSVGDMMLAQIFGDSSVYHPRDFGVYRTADSGAVKLWDGPAARAPDYTVAVPILMYHHLSEETVSGPTLEEHMAALSGAGYTSVTMADLRAYVERGEDLPDKPVVITFDDGYTSNLEIGLPILEKYGMKAAIYVIGCSVGKDTYKDTGEAMTPHFTGEQARQMEETGLITIGSHGYNIHEVKDRDPDPIRHGVLQREDETEAEYVAFLQNDCARFNEVMEPFLGRKADILAYPYGQCSPLSEILIAREGVYATVTTIPGVNTLVKGLPQTLRAMNRYDIEAMDLTGEELLDMLAEQ